MATDMPPHLLVAHEFMAQRSYGDVEPMYVERVDNDHLWYVDYELDEGSLTLEASWEAGRGWAVVVWDFHRRGI